MSAIQQVLTRCDLCGIDSASIGPCFTHHKGFDFCRWCMSGPVRETSCGGHTVTVADGSWTCSCGVTMAMLKLTLWRYRATHAAMHAVPNLASATAAIHVQTPNWPKSY